MTVVSRVGAFLVIVVEQIEQKYLFIIYLERNTLQKVIDGQ